VHELSLAGGVVELVEAHVPVERRPDVRAVRLRVGALAGVVGDSLRFCFDALVAGTALSGAHLEIENRPLVLGCRECGARSEPDPPLFRCPVCSSPAVETLSGTELDVAEVVLEEAGVGA
jgi:hydrogenase nickel incorporation protein HypA/HybF